MKLQQDDIPPKVVYTKSINPNRGSISLFDDTINWYMAQVDENGKPMPYHFAKQRAIDDYRKHSKRQVQGETFDIMIDSYLSSVEPSAEKVIDINLIFEKLIREVSASYKSVKGKLRCAKLICLMFRYHGVDEYLFEDNLNFINNLLKKFYPNSEEEMAMYLGYKVRVNGSCSAFYTWKLDLARVASKFSLYTGLRDVNVEQDDTGVRAYA